MRPIIKAEGLSKKYTIGKPKASYSTLRDSIMEALHAPLSVIRNGRSSVKNSFWALDNVSFEINPGEVVGIIGRNGAGKSTLLKILSRITEPTRGKADIFGRVASLLEVGTGFHPELSGRENIYLNGAILGMKRSEITHKLAEIISFAEVEKFVDTPIKHYSSGMYLRLAFAVAAHLEPEILIIDEVLAVGDISFQRKCLGKIGEVARHGRTVLFVSHNLAAIRGICRRVIWMHHGRVVGDGDVESEIRNYLLVDPSSEAIIVWDQDDAPRSKEIVFRKAYVLDDRGNTSGNLDLRKDFQIVIEYDVLEPIRDLRVGFFIQNMEGIGMVGSNDPEAWDREIREPGRYSSRCMIPGYCLNSGQYSVYFGADKPPYNQPMVATPYCLSFTIEDLAGHGAFAERLPGVVRPNLTWKIDVGSIRVSGSYVKSS